MYCNKCGNKLKDNLFCTKCGQKLQNNNEVKEQKNNKNRYIIIISISVIILICFIIVFIFKNSNEISNEIKVENVSTINKSYELNKMGFLINKDSVISEEYNEKSDLKSYSIKVGDNAQKGTLNYKYDEQGRVSKLTTNTGANVRISYVNEKKDIKEIQSNTSDGKMCFKYDFIYNDGKEYPIIKKYINWTNNEMQYCGYIIFNEIELNNKKYVLSVESNENLNSEEMNEFMSKYLQKSMDNVKETKYSKKINIKQKKKENNIFDVLQIIPLEYTEGEVFNPKFCKTIMTDNFISTNIATIISQGQEIYSENTQGQVNKKVCDNKDRKLHYLLDTDTDVYYKYDDINENMYEYSCLIHFNSIDNMKAYGITAEQSNNYEYKNVESRYRVYLDDENNVTKIEELEYENFLNNEISNKKLEEYKEYLNNNMEDTSSINFDNFIYDGLELIQENNEMQIDQNNMQTEENVNNVNKNNKSNSDADNTWYVKEENYSKTNREKQHQEELKNYSGVYIRRDNVRAIDFTDNDDIKNNLTNFTYDYKVSFTPSLNGSLGEDSIYLSIYHQETGKTYKKNEVITPVSGKNTFTVTFSAEGLNDYKKVTNSFIYNN